MITKKKQIKMDNYNWGILIFIIAILVILFLYNKESYSPPGNNQACKTVYPSPVDYYSNINNYPYYPRNTTFKPLESNEPTDFEGGTYQRLYKMRN
jgi:hypothetical protein